MNTIKFAKKFAIPLFVALAYGPAQGLAQSSILGAELGSFAVLGGTTVTNVPVSTIGGNVGVWPGTAITGAAATQMVFTSGSLQATTPLAQTAQGQLTTAFTNTGFTILPPTFQLPSSELAGLTLSPGVYSFSQFAGGFATLSGTSATPGILTLDGGGNLNATWVFQMASTLLTSAGAPGAPSSMVNVIGTGSGAGLYWNVGSSATIGTYSAFAGNILALTDISLNTGATIDCGRALARNGQVSLQMNTIDTGCSGILAGSNGLSGGLVPGGGTVVSPIPEPETYAMMLAGLGLMAIVGRRRQRKQAAAA